MSIPFFLVGSASDVHAPSSNTAAVLTYTAIAGKRHVISKIVFGYDADPTGGSLKIEDGSGTIIFGPIPITAAGIGPIDFVPAKAGSVNTALIITLAAGGSGVSGVVSADHWLA